MAIQQLSSRVFATWFRQRPKQICWFLGSGASAAAGIPTGYAMIAEFKKILFWRITGTPFRQVDTNDPIWMQRIDQLLQARGALPPLGDPTEYARAFEAVYPTPEKRRNYIEDAIHKGTPSFAHRVLASLVTTGRVPCVFTTNFDSLVEQATTITDQKLPAVERANLTVAAIDNSNRAALAFREGRPFLAKLHGDYQSVELKNTTNELQDQDARMRGILTDACGRFGLIVVGYSGRDSSVMQALTDAIAQPNAFPAGIFWVTSSPALVMPSVSSFLEAADGKNIPISFVESQNFDELAGDIADATEFPAVLHQHVYESRPAPILRQVALPTQDKHRFPILQCSAIPILALPTSARSIKVATPATTRQVRELLRAAEVRGTVASTGNEIAAFGKDQELLQALAPLGPKLLGTIPLNPEGDSWALGLLYDALARAVCRNQPLFPIFRRSGHLILPGKGAADEDQEVVKWRRLLLAPLFQAYQPSALFGTIPDTELPFTEAVQLRLERTAGQWWCVFEPMTFIHRPKDQEEKHDDEEAEPDFSRRIDPVVDWVRERWAQRYNKAWAKIIAAWASMLVGEQDGVVASYGIKEGEGCDAIFHLSSITAWSRPGNDHPYLQR